MRRSSLGIALVTWLVAGCADRTEDVRLDPHHPANPDAPPSALYQPSGTLSVSEPITVAPQPAGDMRGMSHPSAHMQHGRGSRSAASRTGSSPAPQKARYTCPMHPEIVRDKPENCPICGMKLTKEAGGHSDHGAHQ